MDQDVFRQTYREVNEQACVFEKAVLTNQCNCRQAERFCIAEREGVRCGSAAGQTRCLKWLEHVRQQVRFALRTQDQEVLRAHGKAIRIQVGGIRGLADLLDEAGLAHAGTADIDGLLDLAERHSGRHAGGRPGAGGSGFAALAFGPIIRAIQAYQGRVRSRRRRQRE